MTNRLARPSLLALAVSLSAFGGTTGFAAEEMDHSAMGHGSMQMDSAPSPKPMPGMDHSQMGASKQEKKPAPADHSKMDHGAMQGSMGTMDHSTMGHGQPKVKPAPMDHSNMGHGSMEGMGPGTMDHSKMNHGSADAPTAASRTPIPVLTDADRKAAFPPLGGHEVHDSAINSFFLLDQLEYQDADEGSTLAWDASGWVGGDINRLWIRSEGERTNGVTEDAELQLLYGRSIGPWWDVVAGVRQDFQPESPQTWAAFGIQGMALYAFEAEATAFIGEDGQTAARLEGDYDILLTNRLILQPTAEANFYGKNDPERGVGSGLANTEVGLRLRYEIVRQFAPYIGVTWSRSYGKTADLIRDEGGEVSEARFVAGIRMWF
ncbi:copper resistance protein B [Pseudomonas mosselii]|uniref:copper resistance protein B n=1 Tax=Pseudomonas TaxID=286 RepID=UPI0003C7B4B7|nr:copper resistance protein B [Pseudomonas mosselii]AIN61078.1 copper resistance protein CopB [Pseudomonas soli]MBH3308439.1 copper resistance protein B [Pseudomonas mosselii]MBH3325047.1 copper resistance protein B [Pseudomonas mosselii]MBS9759935.1 copper resistance protein B [Pseudomonas mosselii]